MFVLEFYRKNSSRLIFCVDIRLRTCILGPQVNFIKHYMCCTVLSCHLSSAPVIVDVHNAYPKRQAAIFTAPVSLEDGALLVIRVLTVKCNFFSFYISIHCAFV